jgi:GAF domain-containing protein/HAMP domain-containing protein
MNQNQPSTVQPVSAETLKANLPLRHQLRWTLTLVLILLAILPVIVTIAITLDRVNFQANEQILNQLESVAELKRDQISRWLEDSGSALDLLLSDPNRSNQFRTFLTATLETGQSGDEQEQRTINQLLERAVRSEHLFEELFLYNANGQIMASSNSLQTGKVVTVQPYFNASLEENFVQIPYYEVGKGQLTMLITRPLVDARTGQTVGVLAGRLDMSTLGQIMTKRTGLGNTGETFLVSPENSYLLTPSRFEGYQLTRAYRSEAITRVLQQQDGEGYYETYREPPVFVFGVYRWIPELQAGLIAEIEETEALAPFFDARNTSIILAVVTILLAILIGLYYAARLTRPISELTQVASQIAGGDLSQQAKIRQRNEIGLLATAFNYMTGQLRDLINSLEDRIAARTQRLETAASLSEQLTRILNLDTLLAEVVNQIKENFGYYHAHIYLLDESRQKLAVAAGTGEAGVEMKARSHSIALDAPTSLVARAARTGLIVRVDNVREAEDWLPNPLLPNTYSEMAVPIVLDGEVVGVLDVQQDKIAGLDEGDAGLLRNLANSVAVAIRNARLFEEVETALAETQAAQARYLAQSWEQVKRTATGKQYHYARPEAPALDEKVMTLARQQALTQSQPTIISINGNQQRNGSTQAHETESQPLPVVAQSVVAPISLRDQIIGTLQLHPASQDQNWSEEDLAIIEAIVGQIAQTAENLRLFDETRERAARDRLIRQVSDKFRRAPDLESLMKLGVEELSRLLGPNRTFIRLGSEAELGSTPNGEK